jgi:N-glycosylase/DNA lyase
LAYHPFPPPSELAKPEVTANLRSLGFGYRANFIQRTAKMLVDSHGADTLSDNASEAPERWLKTLRDLDTLQAREELLKFVGVGRKVADCVLLMSLDKVSRKGCEKWRTLTARSQRAVIPVDTHVHQIAIKHYGLRSSTKNNMTPKLYEDVNQKLAGVWGEYAGWAHSVSVHNLRNDSFLTQLVRSCLQLI